MASSSSSWTAAESELCEEMVLSGKPPAEARAAFKAKKQREAASGRQREHKYRKYRRFTDEENGLMIETHRQHEAKSWTRQVDIYNAEARKRGLSDDMSATTFVAKCKRFKSELGVATGRSVEYGPGTRRRWDRAEDAVLMAWDSRNKFDSEYKAFITRMRETYDPNYFRSVSAVTMRLKVLHDQKVAVSTLGAKPEPDADATTGDTNLHIDGSSGGGTPSTPFEDAAGVRAWPVRIAASPNRTPQRCERATQTTALEESSAGPDVVPVGMPTAVQELIEGKLRYMQTVRVLFW